MGKRIRVILVFGLIMVLAPAMALSASKKHPQVSVEQECEECHDSEGKVWLEGKHGLMNVKCGVCHGGLDKTFNAKPDIYRCRGCHADKVADVEKKLPKQSRNCFLCHDRHSVTVKFHSEGGK